MSITKTISIVVSHNGKDYIGEYATVEASRLGWEEHGLFTGQLSLGTATWKQNFGSYKYDTPWYDADGKLCREGTAFGMDQIIRILQVVGARSWENLVGARVIVLRESDDKYGPIVGIAHETEDHILIFEEHFKNWQETH